LLHQPLTYLPLTQHEETFPESEELSTSSYQGPNKTSTHLTQYLYNTDFQKILWSRHSKLVHGSYLSYMNNHYQNARNDHANVTKATKNIQHYRYKNHPQNLRPQKMKGNKIPRKHFILWAINVPRIRWYNSFDCTQNPPWLLLQEACVLQPCVI